MLCIQWSTGKVVKM